MIKKTNPWIITFDLSKPWGHRVMPIHRSSRL